MAPSGSILGNVVLRLEDGPILRGDVAYLDDLHTPGVAHVVFVRSTIAHARIESIDVDDASSMPGVVGVYTCSDLELPDIPALQGMLPGFERVPLARDRVRFVGDLVAAVVAETRGQAVDAAEAVIVDYDPLPAAVGIEAAMADGAPLLFDAQGSNVAFSVDRDDAPSAFDGAAHVVGLEMESQRLAAVPMEVNGVIVEPTADGLVMRVPTQGPHRLLAEISPLLGVEADALRIVAPAVGGGFGAKQGVYAEYVVVAHLARLLGRPVKWVETRSENMQSMVHGRGQRASLELGLTDEGRIVGLRGRIVADAGAYPTIGAYLPVLTKMMLPSVYGIPSIEVDCLSVATNTTPVSAYRGAGRPEAAQYVERIIDRAAYEIGVDPVELRRRNLIQADEFPYTTVTGASYDSGDYVRALDEACRIVGYDELRREQRARRDRGDEKLLGIGVSVYVEITAPGFFTEYSRVEVAPDGSVDIHIGTSAHGQGHHTTFAMIVQDLLGIPMEEVHVADNDTAGAPRGGGTMGSRSMQLGGSAVFEATTRVLEKGRQLAAHLLEADVADIEVQDGRVGVRGVPAGALSWSELAVAAADPDRRPPDWEGGLDAALDFDQGSSTYPFGAHIAVVEIDSQTGRVELRRIVAVDDCGRVLNPVVVVGQQHGGLAQGVAQALYEEFRYDPDGNPLTGNLMDYAMPSAAELPSFDVANTETPTPHNPLGAKGVGESATIGSTPAVHNAVVDALGHLGVAHLDMPFTAERVWRAIQEARTTA